LDGTVNDIVKEIEGIIPGNPEKVPDTDLLQAMEDITRNSVIAGHDSSFIQTILR
jgi:hypothetical protein